MESTVGMIVIGFQYSEEDKTEVATLFLKVAGFVILTTSLIKIGAYFVPFIPDEKVIDVVSPIMDLGYFFGVIIWGSVKVFGKW